MAINFKQIYFEVEYDLNQGWVKHNAIKCKKGETGRGIHITITSNGAIQTLPVGGVVKLRYQTSIDTYSQEIGVASGDGYDISLDNLLLAEDISIIKADIEVSISGKKISSNTINVQYV